jgi:hypothetical protein
VLHILSNMAIDVSAFFASHVAANSVKLCPMPTTS